VGAIEEGKKEVRKEMCHLLFCILQWPWYAASNNFLHR